MIFGCTFFGEIFLRKFDKKNYEAETIILDNNNSAVSSLVTDPFYSKIYAGD